MNIVHSYENKDDIRQMPGLLQFVRDAMHKGGCDFLGTIAAEISALDARAGQFFTPYEVSKLCAALTFDDRTHELIKTQGYITLYEPAAGSGSMILAWADVLEEQGYCPARHMVVQARDISEIAYHMCFIQLYLRGVPARVLRGNTVSQETFESAMTVFK